MSMMKCFRSLLFVPAVSTQLFAKAAERGADALILDLEDAVPLNSKSEARKNLARAIDSVGQAAPILVRVNAEPDLLSEDLKCLPLASIAGVMLPKVESAEQVQQLADQLRHEGAEIPIIALIETPKGVLHLESIASAHADLAALGFGGEDYAAALGISPDSPSLVWAAHAVVNAAHAFGLACWGLPGSVATIEDLEAFARLVSQARSIGFTGTVCIHPAQIPLAIKGFSPTKAELEWARTVVAAGDEALARGLGAVVVRGQMIDKPIIERARRWLSLEGR
ncbi:CoA ester lyase [Pusillimonas sp. MFBS29]|uniref:HpcH/HpaI aldolase/citrate lyase family protein n=1 Tax=Pusillimonas sp. MFBS29 TaxID=2886690 RepID=UPI001D0FC0B1|nr:CoA ester lyase [Pusillimonas sp. MFBS29]MCC2595611.1 CoA ester lyase [Pusillimonas sp. MFBS29]